MASACSDAGTPLLELINAFRSAPRECGGKQTGAVGPLAPHEALARLEITPADQSLPLELKRVGYAAAEAEAIVLSGPTSDASAMKLLEKRHCEQLTDSHYSEIGIWRDGKTWRLVMARPLLSAELGGWRDAGLDVLELVNKARASARTCGDRRFGPAGRVQWSSKLAAAALAHSRDMARRNIFAHAGADGTMVGDRATREGYQWQGIGENIATGQGSPEQVISGWLASPGHCANIMDARFSEMGAAYFVKREADTVIYWTQVFGAPSQ